MLTKYIRSVPYTTQIYYSCGAGSKVKSHFRSEPLFMLSLEDCRQYRQNRARYTENDCSVLRSRIRELHPVHRTSLEAVLLHLFRVASHSDKNAMNVKALAAQFCYTVFRGNAVLEGGVHAKKLVMEDLIENVHILFDERAVPSPYGSFLSPELPQSAEVGSTTRHPLSLVGEIPSSTRSSFSSSHSESPMERRLTSLLGLSLSQTLGKVWRQLRKNRSFPGQEALRRSRCWMVRRRRLRPFHPHLLPSGGCLIRVYTNTQERRRYRQADPRVCYPVPLTFPFLLRV
ncbi:hypothetical protein EDB84DRAFT_1129609 [Lactarius hengduanensis]|nr:hypothetical protein EDB84DRAFT_1129609 [Lactarius hengduanensis]